jgi:hypothetical protein
MKKQLNRSNALHSCEEIDCLFCVSEFSRGWKTLLADLSAVMAMDFSFAYLFKSLDGDYCFPSESILLGYGLIKLGG